MRLSNGFVIDKEKTFGELKFTAVRDVFLQNEDGTPSTQLKKRIYATERMLLCPRRQSNQNAAGDGSDERLRAAGAYSRLSPDPIYGGRPLER